MRLVVADGVPGLAPANAGNGYQQWSMDAGA